MLPIVQTDTTPRPGLDDFIAGRASYGQLVGLTAKDLTRICMLGISCYSARDNERARRIFETAVKIEPRLPLVHLYLGLLADRGGRYEDADASFLAAVALLDAQGTSPTTAALRSELHVMQASLDLRVGRRASAIEHLDSVQANLLSQSSRREFSKLRQISTGGGS